MYGSPALHDCHEVHLNTLDVFRRARRMGAAAAAATVLACGGGPTPPPEPGAATGTPPDLRGHRVLVLPVQQRVGVEADVDAELAFALHARAPSVGWVSASEAERMLARSPGVQTSTRDLPVGAFLAAEVRRVGDPLYGRLRRLAALVDVDVILLPVRAQAVTDERGRTVRLDAALVNARTGRVLWFGVEEGEPGEGPGTLATAAESLARRLLWYAGSGSGTN